MLAVKAEYDNGTVRWRQQRPPVQKCQLVVVFDQGEDNTTDEDEEAKKMDALNRLDKLCDGLPPSLSLVDMLLEDRRKEALNG